MSLKAWSSHPTPTRTAVAIRGITVPFLSRVHCYNNPSVTTIQLFSRSHCCHDPIIIMIPLLSRSHLSHYNIVITMPLRSESHFCYKFTEEISWPKLDLMYVFRCLKPPQGDPSPTYKIWPKQVQRCGNIQRISKHTYIQTYINTYIILCILYTGIVKCFSLIGINKALLHEKKQNCTY
jgi:hypothetical protein